MVELSVVDIQRTVHNEIVNLETIFMLEKRYPCNNTVLEVTSEKLDYLGNLIEILEKKKGKKSLEVMELKKLYSILEVRHMLLVKERNEKCNQDFDVFLFFYSNDKICEREVERNSFILSYLRNKYSNVRVYSFDQEVASDLVQVLKRTYQVDRCSVIVFNEQRVPFEIKEARELEEWIALKDR